MAIDYSKFDKAFDVEGLKKDVKEVEANGGSGNFRDVPVGKYEVKIEKMELGETGPKSKVPGSPMVKIQFRITAGDYKNSCLFMNQVITQAFQIHQIDEFLRSLDSGVEIVFESFAQFADLLMDVMEAIDGRLEYALNYGETNNGFKTFEIEEVFEVE